MKYLYLIRSNSTVPPSRRLIEEMNQLAERETAAGTVVDMAGLLPPDTGARIRLANGKVTVTDGPFSEAREVIGGYAIFDYPTRERALESAVEFMEMHRAFGNGWEGECEMRVLAPEHDVSQMPD